MDGDERAPSVEELRAVVVGLARLLARTGPNAPPGFGKQGLGESWAMEHQGQIILAALDLHRAIWSMRDMDLADWPTFKLRIHEWPADVAPALGRVIETAAPLLERWGLLDTLTHHSIAWTDGVLWATLPFTPEGATEPAPAVRVAYPLAIGQAEHEGLSWAFRKLEAVLHYVEGQGKTTRRKPRRRGRPRKADRNADIKAWHRADPELSAEEIARMVQEKYGGPRLSAQRVRGLWNGDGGTGDRNSR